MHARSLLGMMLGSAGSSVGVDRFGLLSKGPLSNESMKYTYVKSQIMYLILCLCNLLQLY